MLSILALVGPVVADMVITDFDAAPVGTSNPRDGWQAFGAGTADFGIIADGSLGNGSFHTVDWGLSAWGIGDIATSTIDLSGFVTVLADARLIDQGAHTGTALLRFSLDFAGGTEWTTPTQALTGAYQTLTFDLTTMARVSGAGALDLANGTPKFIVEKNGQTGLARFDLDEIVAATTGGTPFVLTPVSLHPPPDGDLVHAMWIYAFAGALRFDDSVSSQEILDFCAQEGINRLYFGVFNALGSAALEANLRTFLSTAHASGIEVEALICGIEEYQTSTFIETLIDRVLALHDATPGDATDDFDGVHFDMEFWVSTVWNAAPNEAARQVEAVKFLDNILVAGRQHLDTNGETGMTIGVDLSSHFEIASMLPNPMLYDGSTQFFLEHVLDSTDSVVLMSYIDSSGGILNWTGTELDLADGKGRSLIVACDMQPVPPEVPINTFADNFTPTPFSAMTVAREFYHQFLSADRLAAMEGFAVFHYDGFLFETPQPRSIADLDGDGDVGTADFDQFESFFAGPVAPAVSRAADSDFDGSGTVDLADFSRFSLCYTGDGCGCPVPMTCER